MEICFDAALIRRYGGRGPRYTSYPTALQFDERVDADLYARNAIASNASDSPLSLYVHIPFCHSLCYYCGCNKIVTRNEERVARYLANLDREIDLQADLFNDTRQVEQLHFGGGTPTYLDEDQLATLMRRLDDAFHFATAGKRQFSIEVDPRTVDAARIRELADLGFNRLSLGVQDFDERVARAVNRMQTVDEVRSLLEAARTSGFRSTSFDLIYGLPHQDVESFTRTLDAVADMRPDRLAIYNYAHLPERFKGQRMIDDAALPGPESKLEILHRTIDRLTDAGYEYVGMDHFALPDDELVRARRDGSLQRNFQGYSTHKACDLIGLGASSIGKIGNVFAQNAPSTMQYEAMLALGRLPIVKGVTVDEDDQLRAAVIQDLMCFGVLDFDDFGATHGIDFRRRFAKEIANLRPLADDELIDLDDNAAHVTPKGRLLLRSIAMAFDRYLAQDTRETRFSKAI